MNLPVLSVKVEKTELAKQLEKIYNVSFDLIQKHPTDAGYDIRACIVSPIIMPSESRMVIPTGLKIELGDYNYEIQCRPRSGLAAKHGIILVNSPGTIDFAYRDEIMVILYNSGKTEFKINMGDRIAQLCFREIPTLTVSYVDRISNEIDRGGGFGSSGIQ